MNIRWFYAGEPYKRMALVQLDWDTHRFNRLIVRKWIVAGHIYRFSFSFGYDTVIWAKP